MRRFISVLAASAALGGGLAALPGPAFAKSCPVRDVHAVISGQQKCLAAGEFCAPRYNSQYHRYGLHCVLYPSGYYHLRRR